MLNKRLLAFTQKKLACLKRFTMFNAPNKFVYFKKFTALLVSLALLFGFTGLTFTGCTIATNSSTSQASTQCASNTPASASVAAQLSAIEGITSVNEYENDSIVEAGLDQTYKIYEITFQQLIDHNDASAGTFDQHVRLFYASSSAVNVICTDGYMLTDIPKTAYKEFCTQEFSSRYGTPNIIQMEYRYFGTSEPAGLDIASTKLWEFLTMEQAASDFHNVIQKLSNVLSGKRLWTGTSKGGLTTDYQCYFQEHHGYSDADAFVAFCAPFCEGRNDSRIMSAAYGEIGYAAYGEEQASKWHDLLDKFQLACIKHREVLQSRYYQQAIEEGCKFRESYFGTDELIQAKRLWDVVVNEFPLLGFWQYYQETMLDKIMQAVNSDNPNEIYACVIEKMPTSTFAYSNGFLAYEIQAASEMGDYNENFDYLRRIVAEAKEAAPANEKQAYYISTEDNPSYSEIYLTTEQLAALPYSSSTRNAMVQWLNTTNSAQLIMVSGKSDPWYFVRPELSFSNSQIQCYESSYNHLTTLANLSTSEQENIYNALDGWLDFAA